MTGPAVVSVARIELDLARHSWARVRCLVAHDAAGNASDDLRCLIAVFGHGDGVAESIDRVRVLEEPRQLPGRSPLPPARRAG